MSTWLRVGAALALFGASIGMLRSYDGSMSKIEYMSIPARVTTHALAAGYENIVADGLYLQFIHYFGKHLRTRQHYYNVYPVVDLATDLDPRFYGAYVMGAMALGDNGQADESEALWNKGVRANPTDWQYAYMAGMSLFLFGNRPDQYLRAADLFRKAAALPGAPKEARFMEARMYDVSQRRDMAIALWKETYLHAPEAEARAVAARTLRKMGVPLPEPGERRPR